MGNDPIHLIHRALLVPVGRAVFTQRANAGIDRPPGQRSIKCKRRLVQVLAPVRRTMRNRQGAIGEGERHALEAAVRRLDRVHRPVGQHRLLGIDDPVTDTPLRRVRDRLAGIEIFLVGLPVPYGGLQIARVPGGQVGMGIAQDMQRLTLGGAVAVGLVLHLRMGDEMPVVRQHTLVVLHIVLHRRVDGVAGVVAQKAVVTLDQADGIGQGRALADRPPAVERIKKH
ncbi:hypothetical protein D3C76_911010 [compost metagenome]